MSCLVGWLFWSTLSVLGCTIFHPANLISLYPVSRYRGRRSRTRSPSVSRSPRYRNRRYSRSPVRSRSPVDVSKSRVSPRVDRRRSPSRSRSPSKSQSSLDSQSPKRLSKDRSRSSSRSPGGKKGLVSYDDGSPDSSQRWNGWRCDDEILCPDKLEPSILHFDKLCLMMN
jgi:hypothetical protein